MSTVGRTVDEYPAAMIRAVLLVASSLLLGACAPSAKIDSVRFSSLSLSQCTLDFGVTMTNPNAVPLPLVDLQYGVASHDRTVISGTAPLSGAVPASGSRAFSVPVTISFNDLAAAVAQARPGTLVPYTATLGVVTNIAGSETQTYSVSHSGRVPYALPPVLSVQEASWRAPTFSSLRGTVKLGVVNPNEFGVKLSDFDYSIRLGDTELVSGRASPLSLGPGRNGTLALDVDLDMNKVGSMLQRILSSSAGAFSASGRLHMGTDAGDFDLPFTTR